MSADIRAARAILRERPDAVFVQSESSEYHAPAFPDALELAHDMNERRFLPLDLAFGHDVSARTYRHLMENGMTTAEYDWFSIRPGESKVLKPDKLALLADQIRGLKAGDLRVAFGFLLDLLGRGESPAVENTVELLPGAWEKASDELRKTAGLRYHSLILDPATNTAADKAAASRILDFLTEVEGIRFVPDGARARLYRRAAKKLRDAKDTSYGWANEEKAARTLAQFGPWTPPIAFDEVYQEIIAVTVGNHWGRSKAHAVLAPFFDKLNTNQTRQVARLFAENERVQEELFQAKPKAQAMALLKAMKAKLTISSHKDEVEEAIATVKAL